MAAILESSSWVISSMFVVAPTIFISLLILWILRKFISHEELRKHHDVAGFTLGIIGILYSIILGFTVISVQDRYNKTAENTHIEAMMLSDLYRDSDFFSEESQEQIRTDLRKYTLYIIEEEWNITKSPKNHLLAEDTLHQLWRSYANIDLETDKMKIWYQAAIGKLDTLMNLRLSRELSSWEHLSGMMWSLLMIGGVITIAFMFLFGLENLPLQMLMTAFLSGYISLMLYFVYTTDNVFKDPEGIKPIALEQAMIFYDHWDQRNDGSE